MDTISQQRGSKANSLIEPWVPMSAEIEAINRGDGDKLSETDYRINNRTYRVKVVGQSSAYPLSGPGVHVLNQAEYYALIVLLGFEENEDRALARIETMRGNPVSGDRLDLVRALARVFFQSRGSTRL